MEKKRKKTQQIIKIRNETDNITTHPKEIK